MADRGELRGGAWREGWAGRAELGAIAWHALGNPDKAVDAQRWRAIEAEAAAGALAEDSAHPALAATSALVRKMLTQIGREHVAGAPDDPEGHTRTWEWDDPDPDTSGSDAELEARVADAEATLKASPKDYVARCLRIALLAELTRRRRWRARDEATHPHSEAAGENRCGP